MTDIALRLLPIFVFFLAGVLLRRLGVASKSDGDFLLRLVFFVTLPLLILLTLSEIEFSAHKALLPVANIAVNTGCFLVTLLVCASMKLARKTTGSMAMNTMIANNAFVFPFVLAVYGEPGFADAVLFDFGNAIMNATITYAIAFRYSDEPFKPLLMLRRIGAAPVFWALPIGVAMSLLDVSMPSAVSAPAEPLAQMTVPLILISLGIYFSLSVSRFRLIAIALAIRMGLGLLIGVGFAVLAGFEGQTLVIVALCSGAPIGFLSLAFSSMANLDKELTANAVSVSILTGLVYTPLLIFLFGGTV